MNFDFDGFPWFCMWLGVTSAIQFSCFIIAYTLQMDKITDFAGTMNFVLIAIAVPATSVNPTRRQLLLSLLVIIWAIRLGFFLLYRVLKRGRDARFDRLRPYFWRFLRFWVFQIVWITVCSIPIIFAKDTVNSNELVTLDYVGAGLWVVGFIIEVIADFTKLHFLSSNPGHHEFFKTGLWKYSRHPNYFGEILCWVGIFIISVSTIPIEHVSAYLLRFASPAFITFLLLFLSGITLAEDKSDSKHGKQKNYLRYKATTSPLIPFPPSWYGSLPPTVKKIMFLEFGRYSRTLHNQNPETKPLIN